MTAKEFWIETSPETMDYSEDAIINNEFTTKMMTEYAEEVTLEYWKYISRTKDVSMNGLRTWWYIFIAEKQ
jgi:hypothetical protein